MPKIGGKRVTIILWLTKEKNKDT